MCESVRCEVLCTFGCIKMCMEDVLGYGVFVEGSVEYVCVYECVGGCGHICVGIWGIWNFVEYVWENVVECGGCVGLFKGDIGECLVMWWDDVWRCVWGYGKT